MAKPSVHETYMMKVLVPLVVLLLGRPRIILWPPWPVPVTTWLSYRTNTIRNKYYVILWYLA